MAKQCVTETIDKSASPGNYSWQFQTTVVRITECVGVSRSMSIGWTLDLCHQWGYHSDHVQTITHTSWLSLVTV